MQCTPGASYPTPQERRTRERIEWEHPRRTTARGTRRGQTKRPHQGNKQGNKHRKRGGENEGRERSAARCTATRKRQAVRARPRFCFSPDKLTLKADIAVKRVLRTRMWSNIQVAPAWRDDTDLTMAISSLHGADTLRLPMLPPHPGIEKTSDFQNTIRSPALPPIQVAPAPPSNYASHNKVRPLCYFCVSPARLPHSPLVTLYRIGWDSMHAEHKRVH